MCKTFEELEVYLLGGGEVEFYYKDELYSISHNTQGWYLSKYGNQEYQTFKDCEDLLENAVIESRELSEIWDEVRV
ncbi:hypothetical protein [Desnuesiella massiliensis]|uniref:hypothetical protein n=1 Tax=Desnuesiella massiliensis TaxID=1650662 RepID=UPI0006E3627C|nr:hypothetical protein [Desnuesiella massiliensis]